MTFPLLGMTKTEIEKSATELGFDRYLAYKAVRWRSTNTNDKLKLRAYRALNRAQKRVEDMLH